MDKNIAVIGCGYWGKNLVRNFYELGSLYGVCETVEKRLETFKKKYPGIKHFANVSSVLSDSKIKAVALSTPAATHYDLTKQAITAGKDVFVEKPLALNYNEGEELVSLALKKNKILMVGHILEYHPAIVKLKEMIKSGTVGKINYIYSNRLNLGKFRTEENILWSFAPHDISVILNLLDEMPAEVTAHGGNYLNPRVADVTMTAMTFPSGVKSHIFVSWLHPFKEQKLVIIGDKKMVVFDDVNPDHKLMIFDPKIEWINRLPIPRLEQAQPVKIENIEPLKAECSHFISAIITRKTPRTDGNNGLRVLKVLEACERSLKENGKLKTVSNPQKKKKYFLHESACIDNNVEIGKDTRIWHYSHVQSGARIGRNCVLGQNVNVGNNVTIGNFVKIQNNVSVYEGVTLEDYVFCGPSMVFTNIINPRSKYPQVGSKFYKKTIVREGASFGANSTIICGITIGRFAFVGAGAVVTKDVPDFALVLGNPARITGWMSEAGCQLHFDKNGHAYCEKSQKSYKLENGLVHETKE